MYKYFFFHFELSSDPDPYQIFFPLSRIRGKNFRILTTGLKQSYPVVHFANMRRASIPFTGIRFLNTIYWVLIHVKNLCLSRKKTF